MIGTVLAGRYRLERSLATGGMARVWQATDVTLDRPVAIKVLHPHLAEDDAFVTRFRAEAINAARLSHPGIVSIYDTVSDDDGEAIVMELVRGTDLRSHLDTHGQLTIDEAVVVGGCVAAALECAHAEAIVHRDIKPGNVLLAADGRVLVTDFGIAKATRAPDMTTEHTMLGTAKYLAPEQVDGRRVDGRTDIYALGVVLYEALTGRPPFLADTEAATALARLHRLPDPPSRWRPEVAGGFEDLLGRCLARDPDDRWPSAAQLRRALAEIDRGAGGGRSSHPIPDGGADPTMVAPGRAGDPPTRQPQPGPATTAPRPPTAPEAVGGPSEDGWEPEPAPRRRRRLGPWLVAGVVVAAIAVAGVLGMALIGDGADAPAPIVGATDFDPFGGDGEHPPEVPFAIDGDPATAWTSELYRGGALNKPGVGLVLTLGSESRVSSVDLDSDTPGWAVEIYTTTGDPPPSLAGWGEPVGRADDAGVGTTSVSLDGGTRARSVLVWFTTVADDGQISLSEATVRR